MLNKFETKSNRVKGLSFHPTRPWILTSLHSGSIHLYDYRIKTLLEKFEEHDGPVRSVNFHLTQPLFVSGGDDYKVKVWNYKQRRCLFTLKGHRDYIRTVEFHREAPWIVSCSDDTVIRIWNWQSRTCIAELNGHNHYVMSAFFHPKEDLIVSASLDQTIRIWDISGLKKKTITIKPFKENDPMRIQDELFSTDVVVKLSLEGHDRGVNWAAFHPSQPYIVSASDDHHVKLWRMNDPVVDTFRGHYSNVSCALFHPRQELIISNSEDKSIRVWDINKRATIHMIRREHDRFWTLASHPNQNLFAAGHDSGMIVFKLERERPTFIQNGTDGVFYLKKKHFNSFDFSTGRSVVLFNIPKIPSNNGSQVMSYNPVDRAILLSSDQEGGTYQLFKIPTKDSSQVSSKKGSGLAAIFISRDRFAVIEKSNLVIRNLENEEVKKCQFSFPIDWIFPATVGNVLIQSEDKVYMFDIQQKKTLHELTIHGIRYVIWSKDYQFVAFLSRDSIVLANKKLEQICTVHETVLPKSGVWDEHGVFIYTTSNHLKYLLPNGDNGTIRTLETTIYLTGVKGSKIYAIDRDFKNRAIEIDNTEYILKLSLFQQKYSDVIRILRESRLVGKSIIAYLQKKGYPEVVHFVKDDRTRFQLALECGNIDIALQSAKILDDKDCWNRLGVEALRQGNYQIVEMAYSRTSEFDRLSFLYLINGNLNTLKKMINYENSDIMSRFQYSLYIGDVEERIKILQEAGLHHLAYITSAIHGFEEKAEQIAHQILQDPKAQLPTLPKNPQLLVPPLPILQSQEPNWPLLMTQKSAIELQEASKFSMDTTANESTNEWDDELDFGPDGEKKPKTTSEWDNDEISVSTPPSGQEEDDWAMDTDLPGLEKIGIDGFKLGKQQQQMFIPPQPGPTFGQIWSRNTNMAADHIASGSFEVAMGILNQQVGIVNFEPLKSLFMNVFMSTRLSLPCNPGLPGLLTPVQRKHGQPYITYELGYLSEKLKQVYTLVGGGKFEEAVKQFTNILHTVIFCVVQDRNEFSELKTLIGICREYILGLTLRLKHQELVKQQPTAINRQMELAAYFTHCNMQEPHLRQALRSGMGFAFTNKKYKIAQSFAQRLLSLNPPQDYATKCMQIINFVQQQPPQAPDTEVQYDEYNPFTTCAISLVPIYRGKPSVKCSYCSSTFLPQHKGKVCTICQISEIGKDVSGLQVVLQK
ncbi:WD40 repeat-containing protein [Tieghemostelium lacteum]|uniref:Coatomer subunit alpha n=1 Tax=Tieghemostelium lacteum TaxID=361077 RepID=A0A151ZHK3_TIELA|nr:WD40 repeat-containing protein [Tieghemostelium lacteum]|eukprot:KYQ93446.1 WD40 repeat-containing protein [Tieghemostelium lacteum]